MKNYKVIITPGLGAPECPPHVVAQIAQRFIAHHKGNHDCETVCRWMPFSAWGALDHNWSDGKHRLLYFVWSDIIDGGDGTDPGDAIFSDWAKAHATTLHFQGDQYSIEGAGYYTTGECVGGL